MIQTPIRFCRHTLLIACCIIFIFQACDSTVQLPELGSIGWISEQGFETDEIFPLKMTGSFSGPRIAVSINNETHYFLINLEKQGLFIREDAFQNLKFEPERIVDCYTGVSDMTFEEGYIHNVTLLNENYDLMYASLIKRSKFLKNEKGYVGRDFFIDGRLVIDLKNKIIGYSNRNTLKPAAGSKISITAETPEDDNENLPVMNGEYHDNRFLVSLSTSLPTSRISPEFLQDNNLTASHNACTLDSLRVGDMLFRDLKCNIFEEQLLFAPETKLPLHLTLGLDILQEHVVTLDFLAGQMILQ